jgi:hypothetical protein
VGWLLASLALLPAFLGLFFNVLLGLIVGATVYRVAQPARPIPRFGAIGLGIVVAASIWIVSLAGEYYNTRGYDLPWYNADGWQWTPIEGDATRSVRRFYSRKALTTQQTQRLRARTRRIFQKELKQHYPPGGFVGFLKWSAANEGSLALPRVFSNSTHTLAPKQRGVVWLIRIALSFALMAGAVISQVLGLGASPNPPPSSNGSDLDRDPNPARNESQPT